MSGISLDEEMRGGYLVSSKMKKIWSIQLDMLERLLNVCKDNNLRIWVDAGTMLGAVRHHGYIPWDDDMDVAMPRPDFDKLLSIGKNFFHEPYFLQSAFSDVHYARGHAQLRRSDTAAIRPSDCYRPFNQGIFIDIFPIEGVPDNPDDLHNEVEAGFRRLKYLRSVDYPILWSGRFGIVFRKYKWRRKIAREGFINLYKPVFDGYRKCPYDSAKRVSQLGVDGGRFIYDRHVYDKTLWMPFENIQVPVPGGYDEYLRTQYGDNYMTPIHYPNDHGELILDPDHSYRDIMPEVRRQYRRSALSRLWKKLTGKKLK